MSNEKTIGIKKILAKVNKVDGQALALVLKGIKPSVLMSFPYKGNISNIQNKILAHPSLDKVCFFVTPYRKGWVHFMVFYLPLLDKKISLINRHQNSFKFENSLDIVNHHLSYYCFSEKSKNEEEASARIYIHGVSFGVPLSSVKMFVKELSTNKMQAGRKVYRLKDSKHIVFIGYENTKKSSLALLKKWSKALKRNS